MNEQQLRKLAGYMLTLAVACLILAVFTIALGTVIIFLSGAQ